MNEKALIGIAVGLAIGLVICLVIRPAKGQEMIACKERPDNPQVWWSWYTIEGKQCWFEGRSKSRSRGSLYWPLPVPQPEPWALEYRWPEGAK